MSFRISEIHAFLAIGDDDEEGLIGTMMAGRWMPFVCADPDRVEALRPLAQMVARSSGKRVVLSKFSIREDIEWL